MSFGAYNYYWRQQSQRPTDRARAPRIVIINEADMDRNVEKQFEWLHQHYPRYTVMQVALLKRNNQIYNRVTFKTAEGRQQIVLFNINAAFQNGMSTSMRLFSGRTMARMWPSTASTPTRMQILTR